MEPARWLVAWQIRIDDKRVQSSPREEWQATYLLWQVLHSSLGRCPVEG